MLAFPALFPTNVLSNVEVDARSSRDTTPVESYRAIAGELVEVLCWIVKVTLGDVVPIPTFPFDETNSDEVA